MIAWAWPQPSPYILLNGMGLIVALFLLDHALKRRIPASADRAYCLFVLVLPLAWLGAHALDVVVNHRSFTKAGFVFYGGLISGGVLFLLVGTWLFSMRITLIAANAAVVPMVVAHAFGRVGCFLAGCCYGRPIHGCPVFDRHPTQLYEAGFLGLLATALTYLGRRHPDSALGVYLICYPVFRFFIEFLRGDPRGGAWEMSTSQLVSILIVGVVTLTWVLASRFKQGRSIAG